MLITNIKYLRQRVLNNTAFLVFGWRMKWRMLDNFCVHFNSEGVLKNTWIDADLKKLYGVMGCIMHQYSRLLMQESLSMLKWL